MLVIAAPLPHTVARPGLDLDVMYVDDAPSGCVELKVEAWKTGATGVASIQQTLDLGAGAGQLSILYFQGRDAAGNVTTAERKVWVEPSPMLEEARTVGGRILDITMDQVLWLDETTSPHRVVLNESDADVELHAGGATVGAITSGGAVFVTAVESGYGHLLEWKEGATTDLGPVGMWDPLRAAGDGVVYRRIGPSGLVRRNVTTGDEVVLANQAGHVSLADDGSVAWGNWPDVLWFDGSAVVTIPDAESPITDGARLVHQKGADYEVWMRTADGAESQWTFWSSDSSIDGLAPDTPGPKFGKSDLVIGAELADGALNEPWSLNSGANFLLDDYPAVRASWGVCRALREKALACAASNTCAM